MRGKDPRMGLDRKLPAHLDAAQGRSGANRPCRRLCGGGDRQGPGLRAPRGGSSSSLLQGLDRPVAAEALPGRDRGLQRDQGARGGQKRRDPGPAAGRGRPGRGPDAPGRHFLEAGPREALRAPGHGPKGGRRLRPGPAPAAGDHGSKAPGEGIRKGLAGASEAVRIRARAPHSGQPGRGVRESSESRRPLGGPGARRAGGYRSPTGCRRPSPTHSHTSPGRAPGSIRAAAVHRFDLPALSGTSELVTLDALGIGLG